MKFRATLEGAGKTATGINVPAEVVDALGKGKRPPVRVTINGYTYRSTVAVLGGRFMLGVSADVRAGAGVKAGDDLEIEMALDTAPREVAIPPELAAALEKDQVARRSFDELSFSNRQRIALGVADAKTAETRERRIHKAIADLGAGRA